jgi:hypothetical protein
MTLLELAGFGRAEAAGVPVGARDTELLLLRRRLFGDRIEAVATCVSCGEQLDLTLSVSALLGGSRASESDVVIAGTGGELLRFRVPNAADLAALRDVYDVESGVATLIERCRISESDVAAEVSYAPLSADLVAALEDAFAAADPDAELQLVSSCPACGSQNDALFDVPAFLWKETETLAKDVLADVHELASAYGWAEDAILRLSPVRRRFYLSALDR